MSYRGLSVYGPDSMEELINSANELIEGAKITFIKLKYYRPIIYGDQKTFYAISLMQYQQQEKLENKILYLLQVNHQYWVEYLEQLEKE